MKIDAGSTNVTLYFKLIDPTTGAPETGLTLTSLTVNYVRDLAARVGASASALASAIVAHSDNGMFEVDSTNTPGLYRADFPDAAFAAGVDRVQCVINGAAIDPAIIEVELNELKVASVTGAVGSVTGAVGSVTAAVTTDSASRTASQADVSNLDATVSSRSSHSAADIWAVGTRTLTSFGPLVADTASAVWATVTKVVTSVTNAVATDLASRTASQADVSALATTASLDDLKGTGFVESTDSNQAIRDRGDAAWVTGAGGSAPSAQDNADAVWANTTRTLTSFGTLVADIATAVWGAAVKLVTGGVIDTNNDMRGTDSAALSSELVTHDNNLGVVDGKVDAVGVIVAATNVDTSRVDALIEDSGGDRFTQKALEEAPSGSSITDWTSGERSQIRDAMGITGTKVTAVGGQLQNQYLPETNILENGVSYAAALRIMRSIMGGTATNAGLKFRDRLDTKDRAEFTVDGTGNRVLTAEDGS